MGIRTSIENLLSARRQVRSVSKDIATTLEQLKAVKALSEAALEDRARLVIENARSHVMSQAECDAQIVNFVWGNALEGNQGTRESVKASISRSVSA